MMGERKGIMPSFWLAPFNVYLAFGFFILVTFLIIFQYYSPGPETVLGGAVGCTAGAILSGGWACVVGGGVGATAATHLLGGSPNIGYHLEGATDIRETGAVANAVLNYRGGTGTRRMEERIRMYLLCEEASAPPDACSEGWVNDAPGDLQTAAETVVQDGRLYKIEVRWQGEEVAAETPGVSDFVWEYGPAVYEFPLAMPGGEPATFRLAIQGTPGGVILG